MKAGLDITDFVAQNRNLLESIHFGTIPELETSGTFGNLGSNLCLPQLCQDKPGDGEDPIGPSKMASLKFRSFPLKYGDDIDYKDVDVGEQNDENLRESIDRMIERSSALLDADELKALKDLAY